MNIPADASHQPSAELRVAHLVDHYISHYKAHDPMVAKIFATEDSRKTFDRSLNHDLGILRRRSNKLDDNEISIVQKVFMILSDQGYSKAASSIYLREILGLGPGDGSDNNTIKGIQAHVSSAHAVNQTNSSQSGEKDAMETSSDKTQAGKETEQTVAASSRVDDGEASPHPQEDLLKKIFTKYHEAKSDFEKSRPYSFEHSSATRWLRDTTENCLNYLKSLDGVDLPNNTISADVGLPETSKILIEMKETLARTKSLAEKAAGGKKRRFDMTAEEHEAEKREAEKRGLRQQSHSSYSSHGARPSAYPDFVTAAKAPPPPLMPRHHRDQHAPSPFLYPPPPEWGPRYDGAAGFTSSASDHYHHHHRGSHPHHHALPHRAVDPPASDKQKQKHKHHRNHKHVHHHPPKESTTSQYPTARARRRHLRHQHLMPGGSPRSPSPEVMVEDDIEARRAMAARFGGKFVPVPIREEEREPWRRPADYYRPDYYHWSSS